MSQKFLLKWNNHMKVMSEFKYFLSFGIMVDVTLACGGKSLKAHRIILSACSSFFRSLFLENPCKHPIVILTDIKYAELKAIIDFMYCGEVYVAENQLSAVIKAAQNLKVKGLGEVGSQDNQSGSESQSASDDEFEDPATKISEDHPSDETKNQSFCSLDVENETFRQNESVIEQNDNGESALETVIIENPQIKQEICDEDDIQNSIPYSNALALPRVNFPKSKLKQQEESFQDSAPNLERQDFTADNLPEQSLQLPAQLNGELHQNHSDNSPNSVSETSTRVFDATDAIITDNQQPSTSSASDKRPSKKSMHQPLKKKVKIEKNHSRKSVKKPHNLREPEIVIIGDSNSIKEHDKIKDSESTNNEVKVYDCRICPFKTICRKILKTHVTSRHPETKKFKCDQCAFVACGKYNFARHIGVHQQERPYHCNLCTYKFKRNIDLKQHVKRIHRLERLVFKCDKCDFSAATQVSIQKHMIEVHERIPSVVIDKLPEEVQRDGK